MPTLTAAILKQQNYKCAICGGSLNATATKRPALDHDHQTGFVRGVLCINCNGIEGKVFNLARRARADNTEFQWLVNLARYWQKYQTPQHGGILHHTHKSEEEKRLARNLKARKKRLELKRT